MKPVLFSRNRSFLWLAALACVLFAGCSKGTQPASPNDVAAFKGDPSKMPAEARAKMLAAQQGGAAAAAQARPPVKR